MLDNFKNKFGAWHTVNLAMKFVRIDEDSVYVSQLTDAFIGAGRLFAMSDNGFESDLQNYINLLDASISS